MNPIQCQELTRIYQDGDHSHVAFAPFTAELPFGEMVCIEGPSGAGKSTLLTILGSLDINYKGSIKLFGRELNTLTNAELTQMRREDISIAFQDPALFAHLSVDENLRLAHQLKRPRTPARSLADWLGIFELNDIRHRFPQTLSGGERHRVSLIRALMSDAKVYIFDEPTNSLDLPRTSIVLEQLSMLVAADKVVIVASHDPVLRELASRNILLKNDTPCA